MEWEIKHEPKKGNLPWSVYGRRQGRAVYETGFSTEEDAQRWVADHHDDAERAIPANDEVGKDSDASFPASDPPGWINSSEA